MTSKIIIEPRFLDRPAAEAACQRLSVEYKFLEYVPFEGTDLDPVRSWVGDGSAVFFGSLGAARFLRRHMPQVTVIADFQRLRCQSYFSAFGRELWNSDYIFLPFGEIRRRFDWLCHKLGSTELFVRPDDGFKSFTGSVVSARLLEQDLSYFEQCERVRADTLCVVAKSAQPYREFRFFIANGKIVTASQYKYQMAVKEDAYVPQNVRDYVSDLVIKIKDPPESLYVLDVGTSQGFETSGGVTGRREVIEVNSYSCSGWYAASPEAIIKAAVDYANT